MSYFSLSSYSSLLFFTQSEQTCTIHNANDNNMALCARNIRASLSFQKIEIHKFLHPQILII